MNSSLLIGLSTMLLTTAVPVVVMADDFSSYPVSPADLADIAYRGSLDDEGIPGYSQLAIEWNDKFTTARDVLRAAVRAGMLPSRVMNDDGYQESLRVNLNELLRSSMSR